MDRKKTGERATLLADHPQLKRRIDLDALRKILPFEDFMCHPSCSIIRDEAIDGSDIDAGLVILGEEVSEEKQLEFVNELRKQGFTVYHPLESAARDKELEEAMVKKSPEVGKLIKRFVEASFNTINFATRKSLEEHIATQKTLTGALTTYLGGKSICSRYKNGSSAQPAKTL